MKTATIEELAYLMKEAANEKLPSPIFFLGAGASKTGGVPLASEIISDIIERYSNSPRIKSLTTEEQTYPKLMECLGPNGRNKLLKGYIDSSKINVTHIYLAQLMEHGYVDYVLTVNFDNLMLRALALFNEFPSAYDMAILKDLTTTTFKKKSVVYLHGQHHGLWLLNTEEEMAKVNEIIPPILHKISNQRPWVFIGYSGEDPIFDNIKNLGRFDNGLYWVTYKENKPVESVCRDLLEKPNTNAQLIQGYDADSFMLKLNVELKLPQPTIVDKPFSSLRDLLANIVDIDDQEHFEDVKQRLEISKEQVNKAIQQFEHGNIESSEIIQKSTRIDLLKKEIIDLIINEKFQQNTINAIAVKAKKINNTEINDLLAGLYSNWGVDLWDLAKIKSGETADTLYQQAFEKFEMSVELKPDFYETFYNWGTSLGWWAKIKSGEEVEILYQQAFEKFQKATDLKPDNYEAFNNWGNYLGELAKTKSGKAAETLYQEAFEKFQKAIDINPGHHDSIYSWGTYLGEFAKTKSCEEAETFYQLAIEKLQKALEIEPDDHKALYNWGTYIGNLAKTKSGKEAETLYQQAFERFQKALEIKPGYHQAFNNWGAYLGHFAKTKSGKEAEALEL